MSGDDFQRGRRDEFATALHRSRIRASRARGRSRWIVASLMALAAALPVPAADEIHWTVTGQTSVTFDWRGGDSSTAEQTIQWGTLPGVYTKSQLGVTPNPDPSCSPACWEAKLTGLLENTVYYYKIGNQTEQTFRTPPPRGSSDFWIAEEADIGDYSDAPIVQAQIAADRPDIAGDDRPRFVLVPGDLTYADDHGTGALDVHFNDVMSWSRWAAYMPAWGNHDCESGAPLGGKLEGRFDFPNPQATPGSIPDSCGPGEDWYWFDYGNARFIAYPEPLNDDWADWEPRADAIMEAVRNDPAIAFIVVYGHRPPYSSGTKHGSNTGLRDRLDRLASKHPKYVLSFGAHEHNYERSIPSQSGGVLHIVGGGGGATLYTGFGSSSFSAFQMGRLHHVRMHITAGKIEGYAVCGPPGGGSNYSCTEGAVVDTWAVNAPGGPPPPDTTAPSIPANLTATAVSSSLINLTWLPSTDNVSVTGYKVLRSTTSGGPYSQVATSPIPSYSDTGLPASTTYFYVVQAYDAAGNTSGNSNPSSATTQSPPTPPAAPSNLTGSAVSTSQINLSWTDNSTNEDGFKIERCTGPGCTSFSQIGTKGANVTSYSDTGLAAGATYVYRVRANNAGGDSAYSNTATGTTPSPAPPAAPSSLTASAASTSQINLSWTDNSTNEDGFRIERCQGAGCTSFTEIKTAAANALSYQDTGLQASTSYGYRVRAYNSVGNSGYSNTATATTQAPPPPGATLLSDDFETDTVGGGASGWTVVGGTWSVALDGTKVYQQAATGDAWSYTGSAAWADYAVTTDIKPSSFSGADVFVALYGRWADSTHWYYVTLRNTNVLELKKNVGGVYTPLATTPFTVSAGSWYTVKLEMIGANLKVYVNGALQLSATDSSIASGSVAVGGYNSSAEFDKVVVTSASGGGPPDTTPPSNPTNLTTTAVSASQINLSWSASTDNVGVSGYKVLRGAASGGPYTQVGTPSGTSYQNTGLAASTTYYYVVQAVDAAGNTSGNSNQSSATTLSAPTLPLAPSGLSASAASASQINLAWTDNATNEDGFKIERCTGSGCTSFTQVGTNTANDTTYSDTGLAALTTYVYRVRANNSTGDSAYSNQANATTQAPPPGGGLVTDPSTVFSAPQLPEPSYLTGVIDPTFGTTVIRIGGDTGASTAPVSGTWGSDARHHYQTDQPWSSDGSLYAIQNSGSPSVVYLDGNTYVPKYGKCGNYSLGDDWWNPSPAHPHERINVNGSTLEGFDVTTCTQTRSWSLPFTGAEGKTEGTSWDGKYTAITDSAGHEVVIVQMEGTCPAAGCVGPRHNVTNDCGASGSGACDISYIDYLEVSPSGKYLVVWYDDKDYTRVYDINPTDLSLSRRSTATAHFSGCHGTSIDGYIYDVAHASVSVNPFDNNEDVAVGKEHCGNNGDASMRDSLNHRVGSVMMVRLKDGAITSLTGQGTADVYHVSALSMERKGWAFVGFYDGYSGKPFNGEVIAAKMDGSAADLADGTKSHVGVERFAHHRSGNSPYRSEAHAVPARDGLRVAFASDWTQYCGSGCGSSSAPKDYVADSRALRGGGTPDTTPPVITNVTATSITGTSATINWSTNEPANSYVEYGLTTSYGSNASDGSMVTLHAVLLSNLTPGTTYHYHVRSTDAAGNTSAFSSDKTFTTSTDTTPPPAPARVTRTDKK